jgi:hypothetical protein
MNKTELRVFKRPLVGVLYGFKSWRSVHFSVRGLLLVWSTPVLSVDKDYWNQNVHLGAKSALMSEHYRDSSVNRAIYTTIIYTNKSKSILMCHPLFIGEGCFATCFDLHEMIRRNFKNTVLVLVLCHIIAIYFILIANNTFLLHII